MRYYKANSMEFLTNPFVQKHKVTAPIPYEEKFYLSSQDDLTDVLEEVAYEEYKVAEDSTIVPPPEPVEPEPTIEELILANTDFLVMINS